MQVEATDYSYERELGQGAFGRTFLARGPAGETVVIKSIKASSMGATMREVEILQRLSSIPDACDYMACIHGYFFSEVETAAGFVVTALNIVMDYINGYDLLYMFSAGAYPREPRPDILLFIVLHLAQGLALIHEAGVAHRDVKLENIAIDKYYCVPKFIDFGLACASDLGGCIEAAGTRVYAPAEVYSLRAFNIETAMLQDIFGLGIVFYTLATGGRFPFHKTAFGLDYDRFTPPNSSIPELNMLITEMLSFDRNRRPRAKQIVDFLRPLSKRYAGCILSSGDISDIIDKETCRIQGGYYSNPQNPACPLNDSGASPSGAERAPFSGSVRGSRAPEVRMASSSSKASSFQPLMLREPTSEAQMFRNTSSRGRGQASVESEADFEPESFQPLMLREPTPDVPMYRNSSRNLERASIESGADLDPESFNPMMMGMSSPFASSLRTPSYFNNL